MKKVNETDLVRWEPNFSKEALAHLDALRAQIEPRIKLMREIRKYLRLTQKQVAESLGVTQSNVSKIENSDDPTLSVLIRMAEARGKTLCLSIQSADGKEEAKFDLVA